MYEVASAGSGIDFPPGLPNDRGNKAHVWMIGLIFISLIGGILMVVYQEGIEEGVKNAAYMGTEWKPFCLPVE